ncbi:MAG: hypothetical protein IJK89_11055 [Clostridia bacterium]|nr:hypothetical protein [Clostridia bacterium]
MKNIVNIINFARNCEPRSQDDSFLFDTLKEELRLCDRYGFRSTVLFQYDALIDPRYITLSKEHADRCEYGLWLELTQPQVTDAGLTWKGRYPWDWRNNVNFLHGYSLPDRRKLIDTAFYKFNEIYGYFPKVFGCWAIDAFSCRYIEENYDVTAACLCRDQYGTDGITMWGGYYNGGYYPCANNLLCPAAGTDERLRTPVFRMLGPDPIRQYDMGLGDPEAAQHVSTLEPVYPLGGGSRGWVEWYFRENFNGKCLSHAYAQMGQENSFGWEAIKKGLPMQFEILDRELKAGKVELMTLGEAGEWFRGAFKETPPAAMCVDSDPFEDGYKTVWYNCKNYRMNVLYKNGAAWIRDFQLFDGGFKEKYLDRPEDLANCAFFNLPVMDGFRFSRGGIRAGIYVYKDGGPAAPGDGFLTYTEDEAGLAGAYVPGKVRVDMREDRIDIVLEEPGARLAFIVSPDCETPYRSFTEKELVMGFRGRLETEYAYVLRLERGVFAQKEGTLAVLPEGGRITFLPFNGLR